MVDERQGPPVQTHQPGGLGVLLRVGTEPGIHGPEYRTGSGGVSDIESFEREVAFNGGGVSVGDNGVAELIRVARNG